MFMAATCRIETGRFRELFFPLPPCFVWAEGRWGLGAYVWKRNQAAGWGNTRLWSPVMSAIVPPYFTVAQQKFHSPSDYTRLLVVIRQNMEIKTNDPRQFAWIPVAMASGNIPTHISMLSGVLGFSGIMKKCDCPY